MQTVTESWAKGFGEGLKMRPEIIAEKIQYTWSFFPGFIVTALAGEFCRKIPVPDSPFLGC